MRAGEELIHKEYLTTAEAVRFAKKMGKSVSRTVLYQRGLKHGFMSKSPDGFHWRFDRRKFGTFLMQKVLTPPPGWVSVRELAKRYRTNLSWVYVRIKKWKLETMLCGPKRTMYVSEKVYLAAVERWKECRI